MTELESNENGFKNDDDNDSVIILSDDDEHSMTNDYSIIDLDNTADDLNFQQMNFDIRIRNALRVLHWDKPTFIQKEVISEIMRGKSVFKEAKSGTGKTCGLLIGIMDRILKRNEGKEVALIIGSSRYVCSNIMDDAIHLSQFLLKSKLEDN